MSGGCARREFTAAILLLATALPPALGGETLTPAEHRRGVEQTFLTYPEWFLVHSSAEYAAFVEHGWPSEFPYLRHVARFWKGYAALARVTRGRHDPPNPGYHVMIVVIGVSTTVEYGLRAAYETLVGRSAEILAATKVTAEDRLAVRTAREYVDFINVRPWYEFDFLTRLQELWTGTGWLGPGLLRKWERKFVLTHEYLVKAGYGWLIRKTTHAAYEAASSVTAVVLDKLPEEFLSEVPNIQVLRRHADGSVLATLPRYAAFTGAALALAREGVGFREIAGNNSVILVSVLVPASLRPQLEQTQAHQPQVSNEQVQRHLVPGQRVQRRLVPGQQVMFDEPALDGGRRLVLLVPVKRLSQVLAELDRAAVRIEHVYDY